MNLSNLSANQISRIEELMRNREAEKAKQAKQEEEEIRNKGRQNPTSTPINPIASTPSPQTPAIITPNSRYWTLENVQYKGQNCTVDLARELLDNGNAHTQDEWASIYGTSKSQGEFYTPDYPTFYGILKAIEGANLEEARQFIKDTSRANWLMTLTRIVYQPAGKDDLIIHNYGTSDKWDRSVDFITPDEWIKETKKPKSYQTLLDTSDSIQDINSLFKWLNGTDTKAWKLNSKPKSIDERVARFYAYSDGSVLYCGGNSTYANASLGVRLARAKN
jgi:hypothetical protein